MLLLYLRLTFIVVSNEIHSRCRLTQGTDIAFSQVLSYPICDRFRDFYTLTEECGNGY